VKITIGWLLKEIRIRKGLTLRTFLVEKRGPTVFLKKFNTFVAPVAM